MYNYLIYRDYEKYRVFDNENELIMSARNITKFFGPEQFVFYNNKNEEFARYKCSLFLSISFNHRIIFKNKNVYFIKRKFKGMFVEYNNNYNIRLKRKGTAELFENNKLIGTIKVLQDRVSMFVHQISCENLEACFIFSMLDIALNNCDVN